MYKFQILQDTFNLMKMLDKEASTLSANYGQKLRWNDNIEPHNCTLWFWEQWPQHRNLGNILKHNNISFDLDNFRMTVLEGRVESNDFQV